jgi:parallel beta-helix repeat protein
MAGIFLESSSGASINLNTISGHSNSIHLGNSSPNIGGNIISYNKYHGIYIGAGSLPNMEQNLAGSPPNVYPLSGYNDIKENGCTTTGGPIDNDGSEIFFFSSNAILEDGCNSICDDRSPGGEHPPYNTKLLMNGFALQQIEVYAGGNYWCDNPLYPLEERFGNLSVHLDPVLPGLNRTPNCRH